MIGKGRKRHYDPERCFFAWVEGGTLPKAAKILYNDGITNTRGGIPPIVSVQHSANLYMIANLEITREKLISSGLDYLETDVEWDNFIIRRAKNVLTTERRFFTWLVESGLLERAKRLRLVPENYGDNGRIV